MMNFAFLSQHSSNPLQVSSDDPVNASFVERIRPAVEAEKLRAAQGLPPITSSDPTRTPIEENCVFDDELCGPGGDVTRVDQGLDPANGQFGNRVASVCQFIYFHSPPEMEDTEDIPIQIPSDGEEEQPGTSNLLSTHVPRADSEEEENPLSFRHPKDRELIQEEIRELEVLMPQLKKEYTLIDRLGEGQSTVSLRMECGCDGLVNRHFLICLQGD